MRTQRTIEIQYLKFLRALGTFANNHIEIKDSTESVLRYLQHILYINLKRAHSTIHTVFIKFKHHVHLIH